MTEGWNATQRETEILQLRAERSALVHALEEIEDLGANGATAARLSNIAHAALLSLRPVGGSGDRGSSDLRKSTTD